MAVLAILYGSSQRGASGTHRPAGRRRLWGRHALQRKDCDLSTDALPIASAIHLMTSALVVAPLRLMLPMSATADLLGGIMAPLMWRGPMLATWTHEPGHDERIDWPWGRRDTVRFRHRRRLLVVREPRSPYAAVQTVLPRGRRRNGGMRDERRRGSRVTRCPSTSVRRSRADAEGRSGRRGETASRSGAACGPGHFRSVRP